MVDVARVVASLPWRRGPLGMFDHVSVFQVRLKHARQFCRTHTRIPRDARYFLSVLRGHVVHRRKQRCGLEGTLRMVGVAIGKLGHHTRRVPSEGSHLPRKGMRWMGTVTCELVPAVFT